MQLILIFNSLSVYREGIAILNNADHCFSCVKLDLISVIIKVSGSAIIRSFFPGYVNSLSICEKPAVPGGIVALEGKIALLISYLIISILNQQIFFLFLFIIGQVNMGTVACAG